MMHPLEAALHEARTFIAQADAVGDSDAPALLKRIDAVLTAPKVGPTHGTWCVLDVPDEGEDSLRVLMVVEVTKTGSVGETVCHVAVGDDCDEPDAMANANLISAAKDMLAALKLALPRLHNQLTTGEQRGKIMAAIAKAEGRAL